MDTITDEIERAITAQLYYLGVFFALSLPDVCAALESADGTTSGRKYQAWCDAWFLPSYPVLTSQDLYSMRCGMVHQGRLGHPNMQYARVLFTVPNVARNVFHCNILNDALNLDATVFCRDMIQAVNQWYAAKQDEPSVVANMPRLIQFYPQGLAPYMVGMPLIA